MKILITEKQANKLFGDKLKCKCGHSWVIEKKDKHPYLCHNCGWDSQMEKYDDKNLVSFWKNHLNSDK
jgi:hypothetical protein